MRVRETWGMGWEITRKSCIVATSPPPPDYRSRESCKDAPVGHCATGSVATVEGRGGGSQASLELSRFS